MENKIFIRFPSPYSEKQTHTGKHLLYKKIPWQSVYSAKPFEQTDINGLLKVKRIAQTFLHKKNEQFAQKDSLSKLSVKGIAERCGYENKYFFYRIKKYRADSRRIPQPGDDGLKKCRKMKKFVFCFT